MFSPAIKINWEPPPTLVIFLLYLHRMARMAIRIMRGREGQRSGTGRRRTVALELRSGKG